MQVGFVMIATAQSGHLPTLAQRAEEIGLDSLWIPEHPIIPRGELTPYPFGGPLPEHYGRWVDPFIALTVAAGVTRRLKLATGICLLPEREPIVTAKAIASLDYYSGGRVILGIGAGWLREEMDLFGDTFEHRFAYMKDAVAAMRQLWTGEPASYDGKFVSFADVLCRPAPVQKPHPPVIVGGMGPGVRKRVAAWGDGWMPIATSPADLAVARREIADLARTAGRDPEKITYSVMTGAPPGLEAGALDMMPTADLYAAYGEAGADRVVISVPTVGRDEALRHLDAVAKAGVR